MTHNDAVFLSGLFCGVMGTCLLLMKMCLRKIAHLQGDASLKAQWRIFKEIISTNESVSAGDPAKERV